MDAESRIRARISGQIRPGALSEADVLEIARDLDYSKGRLLRLVARKPWLREASRELLEEMFGPSIVVFRTVMLERGEKAAAEGQVSATINPAAAVRVALDTAAVRFTPRGTEIREPVIFRYEIRPERVIAFVPLLVELADSQHGSSVLDSLEFRDARGGTTTVGAVFREVSSRREDEVLADVSGLGREALGLPSRPDASFALDVVEGRFEGGARRVAEERRDFCVVFDDPVEGAREFDRMAEEIRAFFYGGRGAELGAAGPGALRVRVWEDRGFHLLKIVHAPSAGCLEAKWGPAGAMAERMGAGVYRNLSECMRAAGGDVGYIGLVSVPGRWQGQGVGSEMMRAALGAMASRGVVEVFLDALPMGTATVDQVVSFYERHGFVHSPACDDLVGTRSHIMRARIA